jgi:hypothetical protein
MHQNKPVAPIKYINKKGATVLVEKDTAPKPIEFTLKELAVLQTCVSRSLLNCNCDLNKDVLGSIKKAIDKGLCLFEEVEYDR